MANMRSIFKRTLSFTKNSKSTLEVPAATSGPPWARASETTRTGPSPQIRVTEPTPVDEPMFPIEDLFERRSKREVLYYSFGFFVVPVAIFDAHQCYWTFLPSILG